MIKYLPYILVAANVIQFIIIIYGIWTRVEFEHNSKINAEKDVAKEMYNLNKENTQLRRQVERFENVKKAEFIRPQKKY